MHESTRAEGTKPVANRSRAPKLMFVITALLIPVLGALTASANDVYLSQSGGGAGSSCSSTLAYTYFNVSSNWTSGTPGGTQIGPGTTVHLCGTIGASAGNSALTFQGSGSSTSVVTVQFESGSSLQEAYFGANGAINLNGKSYITINGQNTGVIEATANGTNGSSACPSGSCSHQQPSQGVENFGNNITVENLTIEDMYVKTSSTDEAAANQAMDCIDVGNSSTSPSNITISGNTIHDCATGVILTYDPAGGQNLTISNNTIYNANWAMATNGCANGVTYTGVYIFGNKTYGENTWDDTVGNDFHHNAIHSYQCNSSTATITNYFIYNNEFDGPVGTCCVTSQIYIDNNGGNQLFKNLYIFNNVFSWADGDCGDTTCGTGALGVFSCSTCLIANNTMIGDATNSANQQSVCSGANTSMTGVGWENNIAEGCGQLDTFVTGIFASSQPDYNLYANSGQNAFFVNSCCLSSTQFSTYQSEIGAEAHSAYFTADPLPNCNSATDCSNVKPASNSKAVGFGANLYSLCNGQSNPGLGALCFDKAGNPRPGSGSGNWDAGAFESFQGSGPAPATNLSILVQ